jgi:hypothetical protein
MRKIALLLTLGLTIAVAQADPPRPMDPAIPAGKWTIEFANGVIEKIEIKKDATATVTEPARTSEGQVTAILGTYLFVYEDNRVERWTRVGKRMVVEHWASAEQYPNGTPVRGIADVTD